MPLKRDLISRVYPIISFENSTENFTEKGYQDYFKEILSTEVSIVQIRAKNVELDMLKDLIIKCMELKNKLNPRVKLIVNDYVELAKLADGVHLGQDDENAANTREILGESKIIGLSTHNLEQIKTAPQEILNYLAIGPVFESRTKSGHEAVLGLDILSEAKKLCSIPLVAIGGIDTENVAEVYAAGIKSVAVISDIYLAKDRKAQIQKYFS